MFVRSSCFFLFAFGVVFARPQEPAAIIGGGVVRPGAFPFLVNRNKQCGGALIEPNWFVTGAHCDMYVGEFVDINRHDLKANEPQGERVRIAEVHEYPDYNLDDTVTDLHDIKLVRLAQAVDHTVPARLLSPREELFLEKPGQFLIVAGWGAVVPSDVGGVGVTTLRAVQVPVMPNDVCNDAAHYGGKKVVFDSMLCAGFDEGGRDACVGDSGGPLFAMLEGEGVIVGVISWALGCAQPYQPGVYTRISSYRSWINDTVTVRNAFAFPELPPIASCQFVCGSQNMHAGCFCAPECVNMSACCDDYATLCTNGSSSSGDYSELFASQEAQYFRAQPLRELPAYSSCLGLCGGRVSLADGSCSCDEACLSQGDCCDDFYLRCSPANTRANCSRT